ncbi:MAG TPA: hypothetical protein VF614_03825 [Chthoniobacteraceae bacterium]|jgi:hypothetical protein
MAATAPSDKPDAAPAHALHVELATRITTQRLHYRSGDEETAAGSIYSLFGKTRELMTRHPEAWAFQGAAYALLNDTLRPYTARWHGWMTQDGDKPDMDGKPRLKLRNEWVRRKFREELRELQPRLLGFQRTFKALSLGEPTDPRWLQVAEHKELLAEFTRECQAASVSASLGATIELKFRPQVKLPAAGATGRTETDAAPALENLERLAIVKRREQMRLSAPPPNELSPPAPSGPVPVEPTADFARVLNATALALSGGGIRSATFCLGVVQTLHRRGLLTQLDYLSTVSGGGYLGSFISCYLGTEPAKIEAAEQRVERDRGTAPTPPHASSPADMGSTAAEEQRQRGQEARENLDAAFSTPPDGAVSESRAVRHLRNNSRYLLSGGGWGLLRIAGVFVTGFITSLLMLLTVPLMAAWLVSAVKQRGIAHFFEGHLWVLEPWRSWPFAGFAAVALLAGAGLAWRQVNRGRLAKIGMGIGAVAGFLWTVGAIRWLGLWLVYPPGLALSDNWRHPAGISFAGLLVLLAILWLLIPLFQRIAHGTKWDSHAARARSLVETLALLTALAAALNAALCAAFPVVRGYEALVDDLGGHVKWLQTWKPPELLVTALLSGVPAIFGALMKRKDGSVRPWAQWLFLLTAPAFFLIAFLVFASNLGVGGKTGPQMWDLAWAGVITAALLLWAFAFLNINTFAPHRYYRDRLCECYLAMRGRQQRSWMRRTLDWLLHGVPDRGATEPSDGVGTLQRLPLSALGASMAAPYHLINATLNAAASKSPGLRGRDGDFFIFSRHFCGSPLTGYMNTEDLEKVDPHVDLGTAMAISGAAASTNMGWQTMRRLRFLMTLFNVRLGYWMRRPGSTGLWRPFEGPGPLYFLREMLGAVHEKTRYVNLSDGGHIENLAVYELLRRQCKFIVCVDAGMEPGMECADLMRLQRYAAIDLGVRMHFDPTDLTLLPTSYSRAYAVLVKIDYAPPPEPSAEVTSQQLGWMLYLKLAITGTEPRYVLDYRRQNPAFPHQTTADQFYDEAQFEAYRALGESAAESLFREEIVGASTPEGIEAWFQSLADSLLPDNDEVFNAP